MNFFKPRPGRFGIAPVYVKTAQIGGTNFEGGATPVTASSTTIFRLGGFAGRRVELSRLGATTVTVPVSASGTILATLRKFRATDHTVVTLTGNLDLEALVTREEGVANVLATLSVADRTLAAGDALEVHVVSNNAIGTQPAGLVFTVEGLVQM